jgi:hypothetical protein
MTSEQKLDQIIYLLNKILARLPWPTTELNDESVFPVPKAGAIKRIVAPTDQHEL